jgi:hypothetical protein
MHRPPLARTQGRTRRTSTRNRRTALKNWLAGNWTPRHGTRCAGDGNTGLHRRRCWPQGSLVHWTRSGLWNNHTRCQRWWSNRTRRNGRRCRGARRNYRRRGRNWSLCYRRRHDRSCQHTCWWRDRRRWNWSRCRGRRSHSWSVRWRHDDWPRRNLGSRGWNGCGRNWRCSDRPGDNNLWRCGPFYGRRNMRTRRWHDRRCDWTWG